MFDFNAGIYLGDQCLVGLLDEIGSQYSVYELKAFTMGVLMGITPFHPSRIVEIIISKDQIIFKNQDQAERFLSQFLALWNLLLVAPRAPEIFSTLKNTLDDPIKLMDSLHKTKGELSYLLEGLHLTGVRTELIDDEMAGDIFLSFTQIDKTLSDLQKILEIKDLSNEEHFHNLKQLFDDTETIWTNGYAPLRIHIEELRPYESIDDEEPLPLYEDVFSDLLRIATIKSSL